jgi:FkbM family methyltransferase
MMQLALQKVSALGHFSVLVSRQRWLPYKTRRSLIKRLYPTMLRDFSFEVPFYNPAWGLRFHGNLTHAIDRRVYFNGAHRKHILCFMQDVAVRRRGTDMPPSFICMDIGAGGGHYSLFLSKIATQLYAFEPCGSQRKQLEYNLSLNRIRNVTVYPFALGNRDERLSSCSADNHGREAWRLEHWQMRTGDNILSDANAGAVDMVRLEAKSHEIGVLQGLQQTLRRARPLILLDISANAREAIKSHQAFTSCFPEHYRFYAFTASNPRRGSYRLAPFCYDDMPYCDEIIACPAEKLFWIGV